MPPKDTLLDNLLDEARKLSLTGYAYAELAMTPYGWSVVVLDTEPLEQELAMSEGGGTVMDRNGGQVITAGSGATLDDAVAAANRGMAPRRKAQLAELVAEAERGYDPGRIIEMPDVSRPSRVS